MEIETKREHCICGLTASMTIVFLFSVDKYIILVLKKELLGKFLSQFFRKVSWGYAFFQ
jgi:hypothetical protein